MSFNSRQNLSVGEHGCQAGNITCRGGHRIYNYRFIDTDCQSNCFTVTYSSRELYMPKPKLTADGIQSFITTTSLAFPLSCDPRMALTEPFTMYILNHRSYKVLAVFRTHCTLTQQMSCTLWPNVQIMLDAGI